MLNAIGPVWDGNEVWLVTGGGELFGVFPNVHATAFSGFYLALRLLLASLIFRAVAIEFRSKRPELWWRRVWDVSFAGGRILSSRLIGAALGNIAWGVPIDAQGEFAGTWLGLLTPYPNIIYSLPAPENSLTIYNAASSLKTLGIMLIIAAIGIPVVVAYTVSIYWIFRGKVNVDRMSY